MRIALATRPTVLFGALLLIALAVLLPLRLVLGWVGLGEAGLSARRVEGSVWGGRLIDARLGTAALGDLDASLSPLALLTGDARLRLDSVVDAPQPSVHGAVVSGRHVLGLSHMSAGVGVGRLLAPLPVTTVALDDVTIRFRDEGCEVAEGRVRATLAPSLGAGSDALPLPASLSGTIRCDRAALLVPLASAGGGETATMRITADGLYRIDFALQPGDAASLARLRAAGFVEAAGGWRMSVEGRL